LVLISPFVHTELKNLLAAKEDLVTDLTNLVYRRTDEVEKLSKIQTDSDKQLVESMQQIRGLAAEKDSQAKELADLKAAAQLIVNMVDPAEDGAARERSLMEQLREAPQKITGNLSETFRQYMAHILGLVKSYWPGANLTPLSDGLAAGCSDEEFAQYVEEVKPIADKVIDSLEQVSDGEA
jgi:hypothetical protein